MGFRLASTSVTVNDLERRGGHYFASLYRIGQFWGPITSEWCTVCDKNV